MPGSNDALTPGNVDGALAWLERNLDEMTDAARRQGQAIRQQSGGPLSIPPAASVTEVAAGLPDLDEQERRLRQARAIDQTLRMPGGVKALGPDMGAAEGGSAASSAVQSSDLDRSVPALPPTGPAAATGAQGSSTPLLDSLGRDLTALARQGQLTPILGRQQEIDAVIEILLRDTKRNPVLLGPAGAGKTSIVEGLAQRIAAGDVPAPLKDTRIVEIPLASLIAGTSYRGQLEERLQALVKEASKPNIVLFFDEIHLLAGAGKSEGGLGADQVLKPALARGDIAVIGATTPDDYHATIEKDDALARRFTPLAVAELSKDQTRDIVRALRDRIKTARGVQVDDAAIDVLLDFAEKRIANRRFPDKAIDLLEQAVAEAIVAGRTTVTRDDAVRTTQTWEKRASSTPTLDHFGRDLVALAKAGSLTPIVGRERELEAVIEILLRRTKRNPVLLGPAGSGKTAIVEGLAEEIAAGAVPGPLRDLRIFDVAIAGLAAAVERDPDRLRDFLAEARHPSVIVFFDEIHQLSAPGSRVLSESLKPALARGDIACIGATTGAEFQAYIEPEAALARRFSIVQVDPMDDAQVKKVLLSVRDSLARSRGVKVTDEAVEELIDLADAYMPERSFPDKGVDLVEQAVVYGIVHKLESVGPEEARASAAAYLGFELDPTRRLNELKTEIERRALLAPDVEATLLTHLGVTLRGLDARSERPDAVIALVGPAATGASELVSTLAEKLYGRSNAQIDIDLSSMTEDSAISTLLGSAPGLVGSDRTLPLHELRRSPRQVVLFAGIDRCAGSIRQTIAAALASGAFTDAMGRRIPLTTAIAVLTAPDLEMPSDARADDGALLGPELAAVCDVVVTASEAGPDSAARGSGWLADELLAPLARRFARSGVTITFDQTFQSWLLEGLKASGDPPDQFLDRKVTPLLVQALGTSRGGRFVASVENAGLVLRPASS